MGYNGNAVVNVPLWVNSTMALSEIKSTTAPPIR
jgi:hypothetical protein